MNCRYNREADAYLVDGEICQVDEYGDPTRHCTARRTCSVHVGHGELTCPRCLGRVRRNIKQVAGYSALMLPAAIGAGVNSDAADLAGPAADPRLVRDLRFYVDGHATRALRAGRIDEATWEKILTALPDEDELHPYSVLTRWQMMLSEDYGHDLPERLSITGAAEYLDRNLGRIAQDPEQDFALLAREVRKVCQRLESVLHNSTRPDRGAFCPDCKADGHGLHRLVRQYGHWCDDESCDKVHYDDDSGDTWRCPRDREHTWTHEHYDKWLSPRQRRSERIGA